MAKLPSKFNFYMVRKLSKYFIKISSTIMNPKKPFMIMIKSSTKKHRKSNMNPSILISFTSSLKSTKCIRKCLNIKSFIKFLFKILAMFLKLINYTQYLKVFALKLQHPLNIFYLKNYSYHAMIKVLIKNFFLIKNNQNH